MDQGHGYGQEGRREEILMRGGKMEGKKKTDRKREYDISWKTELRRLMSVRYSHIFYTLSTRRGLVPA